jgi:hypothetical protein
MERQFIHLHGAVVCTFDVGDTSCVRFRQSHDWQAASVVKRIGGSLYDVTLADGSTRRFHANQMRLRSTQLTEHEFTEFVNTFILPVRRPQAANRETGPLDEHAVDHKQETSIQETPTVDNSQSEQSGNAFLEPCHSKRSHISKK